MVAPPLRQPFSNEGWGAETSHFAVLAVGPGAFCVIGQRWELAAAQELNSWCCLSPREQVIFPDNTAKRTLQRAAACVSRLVTVENWASHLLVTSPDCNGFTPQGAAVAKLAHLPVQRRGSGWRGPRDLPLPCTSCFPQPGLSRCWAWITTRWFCPGKGYSVARWMNIALWKHRSNFE